MNRAISTIAQDIQKDWANVYFGAKPYLDAMLTLNSVKDYYGADSAESIVLYFLCNAKTWKGEVAKKIKLELKALLKNS